MSRVPGIAWFLLSLEELLDPIEPLVHLCDLWIGLLPFEIPFDEEGSHRDLRAIADDMERPLAWVARRGIRLYISQILEAEATLAGGDHIVEEMQREARERRKAGEEERADGDPELDRRLAERRGPAVRPMSGHYPEAADPVDVGVVDPPGPRRAPPTDAWVSPIASLFSDLGGGVSPEDVKMLERIAGMDGPGQARLEFLGG